MSPKSPSEDPGERVFVIAPLAAKPPLGNAHRYDETASGRMYVESDPIGLAGGSYSTYAYARGNPVSYKDPLGLVVTVQARNPADQQALQDALNVLKSTSTGYALWQQLDISPMIYVVGDWVLDKAFPQGRYINVDPNYHPTVNTSCGPKESSTPVILGHEFGHVARGDTTEDPLTEAANIAQHENPIRQQLSLPIRLP